jgi:hypothetical protein
VGHPFWYKCSLLKRNKDSFFKFYIRMNCATDAKVNFSLYVCPLKLIFFLLLVINIFDIFLWVRKFEYNDWNILWHSFYLELGNFVRMSKLLLQFKSHGWSTFNKASLAPCSIRFYVSILNLLFRLIRCLYLRTFKSD